jgi:hypothetical protein
VEEECHGRNLRNKPIFISRDITLSDDGKMSSEYAQQLKEIEAFFRFFTTFQLSRPVTSAADLADGTVFFDILALV